MAAPPPPPLVTIAGPPLLGFMFNLILSGILMVQGKRPFFSRYLREYLTPYLYHIGFPNDRPGLKALVYGVFTLEMLQTVIQCHDKFDLYAKEFGTLVALDKQRLAWFAIPVLTSLTGGIVQAFLGWRIYQFSKSWILAGFVWVLTLVATGGGLAQGIISTKLTMPEVSLKTETTVLIWFITTAVNDVLIAVILSFYLSRMKTGVQKSDVIVSRIIKLVVETGTVTAISAVAIVILFFVAPPWFLVFTDAVSKLYANNMMVMFNRRLTIAHNPTSSQIGAESHNSSFGRSAVSAPHVQVAVSKWTDPIPMSAKATTGDYQFTNKDGANAAW
ncbi:hypothetical protein DL96DRAFT_1817619 [Flagelloscypha sp. PMI_526]|nr:hypothetical protein DL96DRAFT_1817619 [Flagelloscypha sp. PMI_526]